MGQPHSSDQPLIHIDGVVKTYPTGAGEVTVLHGMTFRVQPGDPRLRGGMTVAVTFGEE